MEITGPLCPMTEDGRHKLKPWWHFGSSGFACEKCHKTWTYVGDELKPTYPETP